MAAIGHEEVEVTGVPAADLNNDDLLRELEQLHTTRHDTLLHGSSSALRTHTERQHELEQEYLRRNPERDVGERRTRDGARG